MTADSPDRAGIMLLLHGSAAVKARAAAIGDRWTHSNREQQHRSANLAPAEASPHVHRHPEVRTDLQLGKLLPDYNTFE